MSRDLVQAMGLVLRTLHDAEQLERALADFDDTRRMTDDERRVHRDRAIAHEHAAQVLRTVREQIESLINAGD